MYFSRHGRGAAREAVRYAEARLFVAPVQLSIRLVPWVFVALLALGEAPRAAGQDEPGPPPASGPVEIMPLAEVLPGMKAWAWTTFEGARAEAVPVEILGRMSNAWGPGQDVILAKVGGKAARTNVAAGMSGSPVYHQGRLLGAIALRFSTFSPDAIAGITPIELMLEIDELDASKPAPSTLASGGAPAGGGWGPEAATLSISGARPGVVEAMGDSFRELGVRVQAGATAAGELRRGDPTGALNPGEPIAAVLLSGDLSATALGTVSYNDGRKVLGFGHAMTNAGPSQAPVAAGDVLLTRASQLNPVKLANAVSVVGALRQDRHSGILGALGEEAPMAPVTVRLRSLAEDDSVVSEKTFSYGVVRHERWTPQLLMLALFSSVLNVNEHSEDTTFRLDSKLAFEGGGSLDFRTLQSGATGPAPPPLALAASVVSRLQRVLTNVRETPQVESVDVSIDLLPRRLTATIEQLWVERRRVRPGESLAGRVVLQPFRGPRFERRFQLTIPSGAAAGRLTLGAGDVSAFNQRSLQAVERSASLPLVHALALLNQEQSNDQVYLSLVDASPTARLDDGVLPAIPLSVLSVCVRRPKDGWRWSCIRRWPSRRYPSAPW